MTVCLPWRWPALLGAAFLASCAYRSGVVAWEGERIPAGTRIAVPVIENRTVPYRRLVEADLTRAVLRELGARSPLVLVGEGQADLVLEGAITDFREYVLAEDAQDRVVEAGIQLAVELSLKDLRADRYLFRGRTLQENANYVVAGGQTQAEAREGAFRSFAERIVYQLGEGW